MAVVVIIKRTDSQPFRSSINGFSDPFSDRYRPKTCHLLVKGVGWRGGIMARRSAICVSSLGRARAEYTDARLHKHTGTSSILQGSFVRMTAGRLLCQTGSPARSG